MTNPAPAPQTLMTGLVPGDFGWYLGMALRGYQTRFEDAVADLPGGIRGFQILSTVVHRDPPNQLALAAHLSIDRTVLTYLLDGLVSAGVVERIPDPADRRARKIVATEAGHQLLADYEKRVAAAEADLMAGLSDSETGTLAALISRLAMDVHRAQPGTSPCEAMDHLP
ncbi:MarR family transcriptional regulator [Rhodococcus oxybenzonivorans]|uniref:MarR family winged helix-turn-helix transcriptional regulator n=1 Tax=Rhodococcus oxybenzonivorans TaxID=1990687 RepID=UPI002954C37C|nr:MarR family transcriptional regulator [Rhodococcus oxybenzonivorans]MDV7353673.1 MarR family transcriptional regulator [Rhodococcus oxybenzonivorans]